ncbi:MAG: hypothetical protein IK131_09485 [Paludibacteraceae bacterium]|nr:hypothetical protein [Paludibacteraceae bacterium]
MAKITDELIGELEYKDDSFYKTEKFDMYGYPNEIEIKFHSVSNKKISEEQKVAYKKYMSRKDDYFKEIPQVLLDSYKLNYDEISKRVDVEGTEHDINNINTQTIVKMFIFETLYFDSKCNYGWICKCGWTEDKTIAILLSEETPRILTPSQLYDYRKIDDPVFGEMIYDASWEKREKKLLYGKEKLVRIATCDYKDGITDVHRASYRKYQENEARYLEEIPRVLLEYYLSMYDEIKEYWRVPRAYTKKNVTQENIMDLIDFRTLYFRYNGMFAWLCECPWEEECGIAFVLSDEKVRVELQTDIL